MNQFLLNVGRSAVGIPGGILGILGILWSLVRALPQIIGLIGQVISIWNMMKKKPEIDQVAFRAEMKDAAEHAKATRDTSRLEQVTQKYLRQLGNRRS